MSQKPADDREPIDPAEPSAGGTDERGQASQGEKVGSWMKLAGLGMELAGATLGLAAIGYLFDWYRGGDQRYATAVGALLGFALGMFRFVQRAMRETQQQSK